MPVTITADKFEQGAYAIVFLDFDNELATKVFKRSKAVAHATETFECEVAAYKIAISCSETESYVPTFFGPQDIGRIELNGQVRDGSDLYLDLNYQMELLPGRFRKIGNFPYPNDAEFVAGLFRNAGIRHMRDASVTTDSDNNILKVVDFSIRDVEEEWT